MTSALSPAFAFPVTTPPPPTLLVDMASGVPRLCAVWEGEHPCADMMLAVGHTLAARVHLAAMGRGWTVSVEGGGYRGRRPMVAVLVDAGEGCVARRAVERVLESVGGGS